MTVLGAVIMNEVPELRLSQRSKIKTRLYSMVKTSIFHQSY